MAERDSALDPNNYSVTWLRNRLDFYEMRKVKAARFTLTSSLVSVGLITLAKQLSEETPVQDVASAAAIASMAVSLVATLSAGYYHEKSNKIINAAKQKGAQIRGRFERKIV